MDAPRYQPYKRMQSDLRPLSAHFAAKRGVRLHENNRNYWTSIIIDDCIRIRKRDRNNWVNL